MAISHAFMDRENNRLGLNTKHELVKYGKKDSS